MKRWVQELAELVSIASVSADPARSDDVRRAAAWLRGRLEGLGLAVSVTRAGGNTILVARRRDEGRRPRVLIYGHFDVQPADPVEEWTAPPFSPRIRGPYLYGRGASDGKAQVLAHVLALESLGRDLPTDPIVLLEGAEEVGSPGLRGFLAARREELAADVAVISDTSMAGLGRPALTYSLRGMLSFQLDLRCLPRDVHSGAFGGAAPEAAAELAALIAALHDSEGRIAVPGLYSPALPVDARERRRMAASGRSDAEIRRAAGARRLTGESGYTAYERMTIRPALSVNGLTAGYQGPGGKGVIPATASAKLSLRLAAGMEPDEVWGLLLKRLRSLRPPGVSLSVRRLASAGPVEMDRRSPWFAIAGDAYEAGFGVQPTFVRSGGTIPVVNDLMDVLGLPVVLMGFGLPDDRTHAPNERFYLPNLDRAVATLVRFHQLAAAALRSRRTSLAS